MVSYNSMYRPLAENGTARPTGPTGIHAGVVQGIGRRIVRGELAPGEILPEQGEWSRMLGVSRTVVREATKVLAAKGLVESRSKRGTVILPRSEWRLLDPDVLAWLTEAGLDPEFLRSMFEVRKIIEPAAVRLAAERATPEELAAIQSTFEAMARADDQATYLDADISYHAMLVAATHNDHLVQLVRRSGPPSRPASGRRRGTAGSGRTSSSTASGPIGRSSTRSWPTIRVGPARRWSAS